MAKQRFLPWMKFFPDTWLSDTELQSNDFATIGFWANLTMYLWKSSTRGKITGTLSYFANLMGCTENKVSKYFANLSDSKTANITYENGKITVKSRRMWREERKRRLDADRSRRYRNRKRHAENTENHTEIPDTISQIPDNIIDENEPPENAFKIVDRFLEMRLLDKKITDTERTAWAWEIEKLHRIDNHTWREIIRVIEWALGDQFWYEQFNSLRKLRRNDKDKVKYFDVFQAKSNKGRSIRKQVEGSTKYGKNEL